MYLHLTHLLVLIALFLPVVPVSGNVNARQTNHDGKRRDFMGTMPATIGAIPVPDGFHRLAAGGQSFGAWLRMLPLRPSPVVHLFDGSVKPNQSARFAVLDVPVGNVDLVQCADAVMKLRAEWLFANGEFTAIRFLSVSGQWLSYAEWIKGIRWRPRGSRLERNMSGKKSLPGNLEAFRSFMTKVYTWCNTASLEQQLHAVKADASIQPGDVFVQGGFPGHAVLVADVVENREGKRAYLLVQGFMPAQDIHVLKNVRNLAASPWYLEEEKYPLYTPEWTFGEGALKRW